MKDLPILEQHYGEAVWTNHDLDAQRRTECLCYNCGNLKVNDPRGNCPIAQGLFNTCVSESIAVLVTRCPSWTPKV